MGASAPGRNPPPPFAIEGNFLTEMRVSGAVHYTGSLEAVARPVPVLDMLPTSDLAQPLRTPLTGRARSIAPGVNWIYTYLIVQFLFQLALLIPQLAPARVVIRGAAFGTSLLWLAVIPGGPLHSNPIRMLVWGVIVILTLSWINPEGAGPLGASAHWMFHLAILAPVFWVARLRIDEQGVERIVLLIWLFYAASATVGVLQAAFPGRFQPTVSVVFTEQGRERLSALSIRLTSGDWILRPMGLTDAPGGAGYAGFYAIILGVGVMITRPFSGARIAGVGTMLLGMTAIYLCQVRSVLVLAGICLIALVVISALAGRISRFFAIAAVAVAVSLVAFVGATSLGGDSVTSRLSTLIADDAGTVYYKNRGLFVEHTFLKLLPEYPLGAGLGRWGMMSYYFGTADRGLWAEIQWTGWLYDGGILLMILYPVALLVTTWQAARLTLTRSESRLSTWASIVFAYDVGALALSFSYANFMGTSGIEFWVLNAALFQAAARSGGLMHSLSPPVGALSSRPPPFRVPRLTGERLPPV